MNILVSACLLGACCKYSGGNNRCSALLDALRAGGHTAVPVCPEIYGGLPTPRPPAERQPDARLCRCVLEAMVPGVEVLAGGQGLETIRLWCGADQRAFGG